MNEADPIPSGALPDVSDSAAGSRRCGSRWSNPGLWAVLIAAGFFLVNLTNIGEYGSSWDETVTMKRGQETIAFLSTLTLPQPDNVFGEGRHNHPTFYATCNYLVAGFFTRYLGWKPLPAGHLLNLTIASAGLVVLFYLGKRLFNERVGLIAVGFMVFFPRFIAHAHYNPKDVPVMVFGMLTLLLLCVAAERRTLRYWILAAFSFAVSITTKLEGLFVILIFAVPWMLTPSSQTNPSRLGRLRDCYVFLSTSAAFVFLLWPALWTDPLHLFNSVSHFSKYFLMRENVPYLGRNYPLDQVPWHYLPMHLAAVTPVILLIAVIAGALWSLRSFAAKQHRFAHALLWCWLLIPILARLTPGAIQYDGMRHVFLVVPAMALLAGLGVDRFWPRWRPAGRSPAVPVAISCVLVGWLGWQVVQVHPQQGLYLNEGVRSVIAGPKLHDYFDFEGYGTLFKQGIDWVNANAPANASFALAHNGNFPLDRLSVRKDLQQLDTESTPNADFAIVGGWREDVRKQFTVPPVFELRRYDTALLWVFSNQTNSELKRTWTVPASD